jgi:hypothetical protein
MVVVPLPNPVPNSVIDTPANPAVAQSEPYPWLRYAAGGSLLAGGLLLMAGKHRLGLLTTITGATLAMLDQQEAVQAWWVALPGLVDDASRMLQQVEGVLDSVDAQRAKIKSLVNK